MEDLEEKLDAPTVFDYEHEDNCDEDYVDPVKRDRVETLLGMGGSQV